MYHIRLTFSLLGLLISLTSAVPECNEDNVNSLYPYPPDCSKYWICGSEGLILQDCPDGLYFNIATGACDFPENVDCSYVVTTTEFVPPKPCPSDGSNWIEGPESCYNLHIDEKVTWEGAGLLCEFSGTNLMSVNSQEEQEFMENALLDITGHFLNDIWWIGGTDMQSEDHWIWIDTDETISYKHWATGEPSGGTAENCMAMQRYLEAGEVVYRWADYGCNEALHYICEFRR